MKPGKKTFKRQLSPRGALREGGECGSSRVGAPVRKKTYKKEGTVLEALPSTHFRVRLADGKEILAHLAGRLRIRRIRVLPGDRVTVEMNPYDPTRGRIVYRGK